MRDGEMNKSHISFVKDNKSIYTLDTSLIDPHTKMPYSSLLSDGGMLALGVTMNNELVLLPSNYTEKKILSDETDQIQSTALVDRNIIAIMYFCMVGTNMIWVDDENEGTIKIENKNMNEMVHKNAFVCLRHFFFFACLCLVVFCLFYRYKLCT